MPGRDDEQDDLEFWSWESEAGDEPASTPPAQAMPPARDVQPGPSPVPYTSDVAPAQAVPPLPRAELLPPAEADRGVTASPAYRPPERGSGSAPEPVS